MLGAIIGDISGSVFEWINCKTTKPHTVFLTEPDCRFTDDSVLSIASAEALLRHRDFAESYKEWGLRYPEAGYGATFWRWLKSDTLEPYNSWGNGSAMRVSPIGWVFDTLEETLEHAKRSADATHNHPEGVKGAQSIAAAIFLARTGKTKSEIKDYVVSTFQYDLNRTTDEIRPDYEFDVSCMGSVPEAIICFLESEDFKHALKLAISIGGDSDTIACMTGGIAEAFYGEIPDELIQFANARLTDEMNRVVAIFRDHYHVAEKKPTPVEKEIKIQMREPIDRSVLSRAQGCLLGQCAGDALGQLVEFRTENSILGEYPNGVRDMENGGTFNLLAGQPTDDTEMALMLARSIVREKRFNIDDVLKSYIFWLDSHPFDCGTTTHMGLTGNHSTTSQANGSLMRISPLGVYGSRFDLKTVANWAMQDAKLTHPHVVCQKSAAIFTTTIAEAIATGLPAAKLYENAMLRSHEDLQEDLCGEKSVHETLKKAAKSPPEDFSHQQGWVLLALQNAFYHLANTNDPEKAIIETVSQGGDTDTTGAICGALMGAVYGVESIPNRWRNAILSCRPSKDNPDAYHPRPECFWPVDVLYLAEELLYV